MKFIAHVLLSAVLFSFVFPAIAPGIQMHGSFVPEGIICGFLFAVAGWFLNIMLQLFVVGTLGLGLLIIYVFQIFIPVLQLQLMATWFPSYLTVISWESATVGGLCIFAINWLLTNRVTVKVG
ncbi:MAG: hypothetical protein WC028_23540 [Candidatus Obscuribacterales bacterium]|jgi:hypothetical protein|nr:hypothetical protein [bacterium]